MAKEQIFFPAGRLVDGSLYKPNDKDAEGNPLVVKTPGPTMGQPRVDYFFAVAIPKQPGHTHWAQSEWGAKIWAIGHAAFPNGQAQSPAFAWKITDGDSAVPNRKGRKPCEREGYPGCWVVRFSGGYAPKLWTTLGVDVATPLLQADAINAGDYVEVYGSVDGNNSDNQPGVYINHGMVCLRGYGQRITQGPDGASVGFGTSALPQGASMAPVGGALVPAAYAPPAAPGLPPAPVAAYVPPAAPGLPPMPAMPAAPPGLPVVPHPAILGAPPAPPAPPAPAPAPAPAGPVMLPAAGGVAYAAYVAAGWNDAQMRAAGYIA